MQTYAPGYVGEGFLDEPSSWKLPVQPPPEICWYRRLFAHIVHVNYFGKETPLGSIAASVALIEGEYFIIIRTGESVETFTISASDVPKKRRFLGLFKSKKKPEHIALISVKPELNHVKVIEAPYSKTLVDTMRQLESPDVFDGKYRVGLLFATPEQTHENEIFCNTETSPAFEEFMEFIGEIIELQGWDKYQGGLDVNTDKNGVHSLYTEYAGNEIMWHVPTLMPYFAADEQQLERKKHVGNDRAVIIFREEGGQPLKPDIIASKAVHLCIVVQPFQKEDDADVHYRLCVAYKDSVPFFEPVLLPAMEFKKDHKFKEFLLKKLVNGIQATSHAAEFKQLMSFKYKHCLETVCSEYGIKKEE